MDDSRFDDIIKKKVAEYQEPAFDASALEAFHRQMQSLPSPPWYAPYGSELRLGAAIGVSTLLIILSLWYFQGRRTSAWEQNVALIASQQEKITLLARELDVLKATPRDTVYIQREDFQTKTLLNRISQLELMLREKADNAPSGMYADAPVSSIRPAVFYPAGVSTPVIVRWDLQPETMKETAPNGLGETGKFSAKTHRELEKHYRNGIGIRIGPAVDVSKGKYQAGNGRMDLSGALLADVIISPSLSIESGGRFTHRFYEVPGDEITSGALALPNINRDLGPLVTADVDTWMLELPIHLKYRAPLSPTSHWLAGAGYSAFIMTRQIFEYDYQLDGSQSVKVNESHSFDGMRTYPGMLNFSLGMSNQFRNNKILETSFYYQHGTGKRGIEQIQANYFGLRAAYWFTIR